MVNKIRIENFKSINKLEFEPGRFNLLIGENGSGKSNILEAIVMAGAAVANKLDNEFLVPRGIRMTEPEFMFSCFPGVKNSNEGIKIFFQENENSSETNLRPVKEMPYSWVDRKDQLRKLNLTMAFLEYEHGNRKNIDKKLLQAIKKHKSIKEAKEQLMANNLFPEISKFVTYSPENTLLRNFEVENQIFPLGIKGEGLFEHLKRLGEKKGQKEIKAIREALEIFDWFESFEVPKNGWSFERRLKIKDRYLGAKKFFDQRSANEGFLFVLFYLTLFISPETPSFFAIDNIDASLNPKLVKKLVIVLADLAKKHNKQVIATTHNPAALDGININDPEQRLFVVSRDSKGQTRPRRIERKNAIKGQKPVNLSEAFMRGYLGGLPQNF